MVELGRPSVVPDSTAPQCDGEGADRLSERSHVIVPVQGNRPRDEAMQELAVMFAVLADPGRLALLAVMLHAGEMRVGDLAAATGQSASAASHALRVLRMHRVVTVRRAGRTGRYRLADSRVRTLFGPAIDHAEPHSTPQPRKEGTDD
jgi:DNA-binding transcriptional ArsR family regulator